MYIKVRWSLLFMCSFIVLTLLVGILPAASAKVVTYRLNNVHLLPGSGQSQQMTGSFEWIYEEGDFENGSGRFIELDIPWYSSDLDSLNINIDLRSIEFVLPGNYHDLGLDITLFLLEPLSPDQPVSIDTARSKFEIQHGIIYMGSVMSGSIVLVTPISGIVKVNGSDVPVTVSSGSPVSVTISLNAGNNAGDNVDLWVVADTPFGWYYYTSTGWQPGLTATYMGPLFNLNTMNILNSILPQGNYTFYFGADLNMNGTPDIGSMFYDSIAVDIVP